MLQSVAAAGRRSQALLKHLPAGTPNGRSATFTLGGQTYTVPLGSLTGRRHSSSTTTRAPARIDHQLAQNHTLAGRYLFDDTSTDNTGARSR